VGLNQWRLHWLTLTQNLIGLAWLGLAQFAVLALKLLDPRLLLARRPRSFATVALDPGAPKTDRLSGEQPDLPAIAVSAAASL
jgi:hypothetical protein